PTQDNKSKAILEQMLVDEKQHGIAALDAGAAELPSLVRQAMTAMSELMKQTTYRL
ncbi:MAG: demethoxyubiquinone hydroxylase family protein, partial [Chloroflexi bacterium]|nr:demethoxyubiquinone hydroxylase family protein [Chloroflexota bacterium]